MRVGCRAVDYNTGCRFSKADGRLVDLSTAVPGVHYQGVRSIGDPAQDPNGAQLLGFYVADPDRHADFWLGQDRFIPIDRWVNELLK